jgi:hypothetical protein
MHMRVMTAPDIRYATLSTMPEMKGRLARVIHAYPTQGETVRQAAQACVQSLAAVAPATKKETT